VGTIYNFNAGPAVLPPTVLQQAQAELRDYQGRGMSILEMSHRSKEYEVINAQAEQRLMALLGLKGGYRALFVQGGASTQFAMVPLNFLASGATADYLITGSWSEKACDEAKRLGHIHSAADTAADGYRRTPNPEEIRLSADSAYVHLTSNETIHGVQWQRWPEVGAAPLIADMSSDILSRPLDARTFALIYAGAQKNLGPAGVTVVLIRDDMLERAAKTPPSMLRYSVYAKNNSLYNTPPVFAVYLLNLVLGWIGEQGGLAAMERRNSAKAAAVYAAIDGSAGFYRGHAAPDSRSAMNVTFRLPTPELEARFVTEATGAGMVGLAGHRSVGGARASLYNALDQPAADALAAFMIEFARVNG